MKLVCPESQKRLSLKCGNMVSGSALVSLDTAEESSDSGDAEAVVSAEAVAACDCVQPKEGKAMKRVKSVARSNADALTPRLPVRRFAKK